MKLITGMSMSISKHWNIMNMRMRMSKGTSMRIKMRIWKGTWMRMWAKMRTRLQTLNRDMFSPSAV